MSAGVIQTMRDQIGMGNILATSGGRVLRHPTLPGIILPVRYGYRVVVTYREGHDDYEVRREFVRGAKVFPKGTETTYAAELGDTVYRAGCYVNVDFGQTVDA